MNIPLGGFVPSRYLRLSYIGHAPQLYASLSYLQGILPDLQISAVYIDVAKGMDEQVMAALNEIIQASGNAEHIALTSRAYMRGETRNAKNILYIVGLGAAGIIGLIAVLNFINIMYVGALSRTHECAVLEAVGMERSRVRAMLTWEGLVYAIVTLVLAGTAGSGLAFYIFKQFSQEANYAVFAYPFAPMAVILAAIFTVCFVTPQVVFRAQCKATVVERLRVPE
jgi:putative ABC transport system permease protein